MLKVVIDLSSLFNLIFQIKVKEIQLLGRTQLYQKLRGIDSNPLHTYFEHELEVFITDFVKQIIYSTGTFLRANIEGFNIILGWPWLKKIRVSINWENDY